ncbi:MAG: gas vesicle protein GvpO [Pseudomonadota bacterium]
MDTIQASEIAKSAIVAITGHQPEALIRCENVDKCWSVDVVIVESKAKLQDNDILATYTLKIDNSGGVMSYERVNRYIRSSLLNVAGG